MLVHVNRFLFNYVQRRFRTWHLELRLRHFYFPCSLVTWVHNCVRNVVLDGFDHGRVWLIPVSGTLRRVEYISLIFSHFPQLLFLFLVFGHSISLVGLNRDFLPVKLLILLLHFSLLT